MSGGGGKAVSKKEYKEMSENYSGWMSDLLATRERDRGRMQSRMAMGGVKTGSDLWKKNLETSGTQFDKQLKEIRGGQTAKRIQENYKKYQEAREKPLEFVFSERDLGGGEEAAKKKQMPGLLAARELEFKNLYGVKGGDAGMKKLDEQMGDISKRYKETYGVELKDWEAWAMANYGEPSTQANAKKGERLITSPGFKKPSATKAAMMGGAAAKAAASPWMEQEEEGVV